jgi:hypothetical protein
VLLTRSPTEGDGDGDGDGDLCVRVYIHLFSSMCVCVSVCVRARGRGVRSKWCTIPLPTAIENKYVSKWRNENALRRT